MGDLRIPASTTLAVNSVAANKLVAGLAGQVIGGTVPAYAYPPGYQINLTQATGGDVSITGTTTGTSQLVLDSGSITYDGTAVKITFSSAYVDIAANAAGNAVTVYLADASVNATNSVMSLAIPSVGIGADDSQFPVQISTWITPSAGAHQYTIRVFRSNANSSISATATRPATLEITKA